MRLNRAIAVAEANSPHDGLALLAGLDNVLHDSHRLAAVRGELAHRAGDTELAIASYRTALVLCANDVERAHIQSQMADIETLARAESARAARGQ